MNGLYRGTVDRIDTRGAYIKVPQLGGTFGPLLMMCDNAGQTATGSGGSPPHTHPIPVGAWLSPGDTVAVAQWGHQQEDLVILGRAVVPLRP